MWLIDTLPGRSEAAVLSLGRRGGEGYSRCFPLTLSPPPAGIAFLQANKDSNRISCNDADYDDYDNSNNNNNNDYDDRGINSLQLLFEGSLVQR